MDLFLRILTKLENPYNLNSPENIIVRLPYESGETLEKSMTNGAVKIIDMAAGKISVTISDFEIQGLNVGEKQNFSAEVYDGRKKVDILFQRSLTVTIKDGKKTIV